MSLNLSTLTRFKNSWPWAVELLDVAKLAILRRGVGQCFWHRGAASFEGAVRKRFRQYLPPRWGVPLLNTMDGSVGYKVEASCPAMRELLRLGLFNRITIPALPGPLPIAMPVSKTGLTGLSKRFAPATL